MAKCVFDLEDDSLLEEYSIDYSYNDFCEDLKKGNEFFMKYKDYHTDSLYISIIFTKVNVNAPTKIFLTEKRGNIEKSIEVYGKSIAINYTFMNNKTLKEMWSEMKVVTT